MGTSRRPCPRPQRRLPGGSSVFGQHPGSLHLWLEQKAGKGHCAHQDTHVHGLLSLFIIKTHTRVLRNDD